MPVTVEKLLVRLLPRPSMKSLFVGDVVAMQSPLTQAERSIMVRRVAAMQGAEMVSDDADDASWRIPDGHCWVLADNEALKPAQVIDSRSFGPLPLENVVGRVIYQCQSQTDHGTVQNSEQAADMDEPVLAAELDTETFCQPQSALQSEQSEDTKQNTE